MLGLDAVSAVSSHRADWDQTFPPRPPLQADLDLPQKGRRTTCIVTTSSPRPVGSDTLMTDSFSTAAAAAAAAEESGQLVRERNEFSFLTFKQASSPAEAAASAAAAKAELSPELLLPPRRHECVCVRETPHKNSIQLVGPPTPSSLFGFGSGGGGDGCCCTD